MTRCQIARTSRSGLFQEHLSKLRLHHRAREAAYGAFFSTVFLLCQPANSLAIDDIRVLSRLGEPLRAEIVVTPAAGEVLDRGCLSSTRASGELPGIDRVSLSLSRSLNGHVIGVTSARPMREPMSEFVLQVKCPGVPTMVRNFLVMVDPPTVGEATAPAQAATLTSLRTARAAARSGSTGNIEPGSRYTVRSGDMLSTIASRVAGRPDWSVWPIAQQIYASNPGAFLLGDPNMISEGSTIYIPQLSEVDMRATARVQQTTANAVRPVPAVAPSVPAVVEPVPAPAPTQQAARILPPPTATVTLPAISLPTMQLTMNLLSESRMKVELRAQGMPVAPAVRTTATPVQSPIPAVPTGPQSQPDRPDDAATATRAALQPDANSQQSGGLNWLWVVVGLLTGLLMGAIAAAALLRRNLRREYEHDVRETVTRQTQADRIRRDRDRHTKAETGSFAVPTGAATAPTMELPRPAAPSPETADHTVEMATMPGLDFEVSENLPDESDTIEAKTVSEGLDLELPGSTGQTGQHEVDFDLLEQAYSEDYQTEFVEKDAAAEDADENADEKESYYHLENHDPADDTPLPIELGEDEMGDSNDGGEPKVVRFRR